MDTKDRHAGQDMTVVIVDDDREFTGELKEYFRNTGCSAMEAHSGEEGWKILQENRFDLLILDVKLPGMSGLDLLQQVKSGFPSMEVIVISAHGDMETVIQAMRLGAIDYLRKPFRHVDIRIAMERTGKFMQLSRKLNKAEQKNSLISQTLQERIERHMIGVSPQIREVLDLAMTSAGVNDTSVLITGESGTGKENIARIIHFASARKEEILFSVNSGSISESLYESEFFGHKKGAFTGADRDKKGYFELCDKGTLFLDEIADMPLNLQAKVLRALEEKKITRVGDTTPIPTDFRIIAASNHDLDQLVREKRFRLDLLHRLQVLTIHIPPLRERPEDIEPLLTYFTEHFARTLNKPVQPVDPAVIRMLSGYSFPGNVRELRNMAERAVILSRSKILGIRDFPVKHEPVSPAHASRSIPKLEEQELQLILEALKNSGMNQTEAAEILGISRDSLIRKMKKHRLDISRELHEP